MSDSNKLNEIKGMEWCPEADLNHRHADFQSAALPTELSGHPVRVPEGQDQQLVGKGVF